MKMRPVSPTIYVDTNIIRDYSDRRDPQSIHLLETIRRKKWKCSSSVFTMMELCDVEKDHLFFQNTYVRQKWSIDRFLRERYRRTLTNSDFKSVQEYIANVKESLNFINFYALQEDGWNIALNLSMNTNLRAADCIQLSTAINLKSEILVTKDDHLQKVVKRVVEDSDGNIPLKVHDPKSFLQILDISK